MDLVDWLNKHPEAKVNAAELFGVSYEEDALDHLLNDFHHVVDLVEALSNRVAASGTSADVKDEFVKLQQQFRDGARAIDQRGTYIQKTFASLVGVRDLQDARLILRGALPHAPTEADRNAMMSADETLKDVESGGKGIMSGGSWIWCLIGCVICEVGCLVCCTILLETNTREK